MTSQARKEFIESINALETACDEPSTKDQTAMGRVIRKGLTVATFNTLEGFIEARWRELTAYANTGHTQFQDLPEPMQLKILRRTLETSAGELRRSKFDLQDLTEFSKDLGKAMSTISDGLSLHHLAAKWDGSNISSGALTTSMKVFNIDAPWDNIRDLGAKIGYPAHDHENKPVKLNEVFDAIMKSRHRAAHEMSFNITLIELRAMPSLLLRVAFGFDVLASEALRRIQSGDEGYLKQSILVKAEDFSRFWVVEKRTRDFALHSYPRAANSRAKRVDADGDALFSHASSSAAKGEFVVRLNESRKVLDWSIPGAG